MNQLNLFIHLIMFKLKHPFRIKQFISHIRERILTLINIYYVLNYWEPELGTWSANFLLLFTSYIFETLKYQQQQRVTWNKYTFEIVTSLVLCQGVFVLCRVKLAWHGVRCAFCSLADVVLILWGDWLMWGASGCPFFWAWRVWESIRWRIRPCKSRNWRFFCFKLWSVWDGEFDQMWLFVA